MASLFMLGFSAFMQIILKWRCISSNVTRLWKLVNIYVFIVYILLLKSLCLIIYRNLKYYYILSLNLLPTSTVSSQNRKNKGGKKTFQLFIPWYFSQSRQTIKSTLKFLTLKIKTAQVIHYTDEVKFFFYCHYCFKSCWTKKIT